MTEDKGPTVEECLAHVERAIQMAARTDNDRSAFVSDGAVFRAIAASLRRIPLLEADLERMRGALEPFAAVHVDADCEDEWAVQLVDPADDERGEFLQAGDFRRARQALEAKHD